MNTDPNQKHHIRVPVTVSILTSIIVGAFATGGTWALLSAKVADAQARAASAENRLTNEEQRNASQDTAIAVAQQQFQEILRRLNNIEAKIDETRR